MNEETTTWSYDFLENLDTSKYPFPNTLWHVKSANEIVLKTTLMLIAGIIGILLNSVIILTLMKNKWLWSASNYLIGNLALIDLLTLIFCPWFMLVKDFYQCYMLRSIGCRLEGFMQATFLLANVGAVMLVSYDRLAAAALTSDARVTKSAAPKLIVGSWIISVALSLPWIIKREYHERQWLDYVEKFCVEDVTVLDIYWHFTQTLLVWIPLGIMIVTYGTILCRLEWSARELSSRGGGQAVTRARGKAMRITAFVLLADVVCRLPYSVLLFWRHRMEWEINAVDGAYNKMWFAANYLMFLNCALNPLIYGYTNIRFRRAMDRTPVVAWFKFGAWCCVCKLKKKKVQDDKNTEKIFVIENTTEQPNKKIVRAIKNILHIHMETIDIKLPKCEEITTKPTKLTPIKTEHL